LSRFRDPLIMRSDPALRFAFFALITKARIRERVIRSGWEGLLPNQFVDHFPAAIEGDRSAVAGVEEHLGVDPQQGIDRRGEVGWSHRAVGGAFSGSVARADHLSAGHTATSQENTKYPGPVVAT